MGTLFNQSPRNYREVSLYELDLFLKQAADLANEFNISVSDVIEAKKALEMERQNSLCVASGDTLDEQLAGFGQILQEMVAAIERIGG